jgi:hypothetical protein
MDGRFLIALVMVAAVAYALYRQQSVERFTETVHTSPKQFSLKPSLWWFVEDGANSRAWWDFGARNSHKPNRGYVQVALESLYATQAFDFNIYVLLGRKAVSDAIREAGEKVPEGVASMPVAMWRQWALSNLLAAKGGLVMAGDSTLCVGPTFTPVISNLEAAAFGIAADEPRAVPGTSESVLPAPWVGWAAKPHTPAWDVAAAYWTRLASAGPTSWSAAEARGALGEVWEIQKAKGITHLQVQDGGRRSNGYELTLEDLLMKKAIPLDPKITLPAETIYVPMDGDKLVREYRYAWFVRMSKDQILGSNFVWAFLAKKHRPRLFTPMGI